MSKEEKEIFQQEILDYLKNIVALGEEKEFINKVRDCIPDAQQQAQEAAVKQLVLSLSNELRNR